MYYGKIADARALPVGSQASDPRVSETCRQIQAQYDEYAAGFADRDISRIVSVMTGDFRWKLIDGGSMNLEQTRAAIEEQLAETVRVHEMEITVDEVETEGDLATVYASERLVTTVSSTDGRLERMTSEETYRDRWIRSSEGWKLSTAEVLTSRAIFEPED